MSNDFFHSLKMILNLYLEVSTYIKHISKPMKNGMTEKLVDFFKKLQSLQQVKDSNSKAVLLSHYSAAREFIFVNKNARSGTFLHNLETK